MILSYIADKYALLLENDCRGSTVEARALSALLVRVHDMYISGTNCSQPQFFSNQAPRRSSPTRRAPRLRRTRLRARQCRGEAAPG